MHKIIFLLISAVVLLLTAVCDNNPVNQFQTGDILFQSLNSPQCQAIKIATNSKYSHCGLINIIDGKTCVIEGTQPVKLTPVKDWINRGIDSHYVAKRLTDFDKRVSPADINKAITVGDKYLDKDYDFFFGWSDSLIYCSELVWKVYKEAWGIELCPLKKLADFDLSHPVVRAKAEERYGENIPLDEPVVAPADLFDSDMLYELTDIRLP